MQWKSFQLLIPAAMLLAASAAASDKPAFSGTWMLDADQSQGSPAWASMVVVQKGHWFRMAQNDKEGRVIRSFEGECKTDGRFHPVQGGDGGSISCKWDGSALTTRQHWNDDHNERSVRTALAPDGTMIQEIHEIDLTGVKDTRLIWKRQ